jgi:O-antigen ligase
MHARQASPKLSPQETSSVWNDRFKTFTVLAAGCLLLAAVLCFRPGYLADTSFLGALLVMEVLLAAICRYKRFFFFFALCTFLWAGVDLPFHGAWLQGRWIVLAVGAVAGLAVYMKEQNHRFTSFHLLALFCVLSAVVSGLISAYPEEAILKAVSLSMLFLYASAGVRVAISLPRPERFFHSLLVGCEALTYITAFCYFVLRHELFGSPNSLGAVMGVAVTPVLLWGFISSQEVAQRRRRAFELALAIMLLMCSFSRAGIAAAAVSCFSLCIATRHYRLLIKGISAALVLGALTIMFLPQPQEAPHWDGSQSIVNLLLYKGKPQQGVIGSRRGPWQETWAVIKDRPWFGSGFGTSFTGEDLTRWEYGHGHIDTRAVREHGSSYLAIAEWVGLLGVLPFYSLIILTAVNVGRVFTWLRRTGELFSPAVPVAAVVLAGLVDCFFEDWMFAVGYYLSLFFWGMAFILVDLAPGPAVSCLPDYVISAPDPYVPAMATGK